MLSTITRSKLEPIPWRQVDWERLDACEDRVVFQSKPWIEFLAEVQNAEPVVARLAVGKIELGFFTGLIVQRVGLRFLGSPLPGWTTPYMGFNLAPGADRADAVRALAQLAFNDLGCAHFELRDCRLADRDVGDLGLARRHDVGYDDRTFEVDLSPPEDAIFGAMSSACRRAIRKAEKSGVVIEEASDPGFADEFYAQLRQVFLRQGLVPTYDVERVRSLIRHLHPAGMVLLLRARDPEGRCIATGIYPAFGNMMFFWGGASLREHQHWRPNETLHWHAMRYWKAHGATRYDLGGYVDYKAKYGGVEVSIPGFHRSRSRLVAFARAAAPMGVRAKQSIVGGATNGLRTIATRLAGQHEQSHDHEADPAA